MKTEVRTEVKYILELIQEKTITIDNGIERIFNLFGVSVSEVEFCSCGNPSGGRHSYFDTNEQYIECADCGKRINLVDESKDTIKCSKCGSAMVAEMIEGNWCQKCGWIE